MLLQTMHNIFAFTQFQLPFSSNTYGLLYSVGRRRLLCKKLNNGCMLLWNHKFNIRVWEINISRAFKWCVTCNSVLFPLIIILLHYMWACLRLCWFFVSQLQTVVLAFKITTIYPRKKEGILPVATLSTALSVRSKSRSSRDVAPEVCNFVIGIINFNE